MKAIPGEIRDLMYLTDAEGETHLVAEVAVENVAVPLRGLLVAPPNGAVGQIGFHPVEQFSVVEEQTGPVDPERRTDGAPFGETVAAP